MSLLSRVLLLVGLSVIPALILQGFTLFRAHSLEQAMTREEALRSLGFIEAELARVVEGARHVLAATSEAASVRDRQPQACTALLDRITKHLSPSYEFHVTNPRGRIICSSQPSAPGIDIGDRYHVRHAMAEQAFTVGEYVLKPSTDQPAITFGAPYWLATGELGGAIAMTLDLAGLRKELESRGLPEGATITVTDRNGTVLMTSQPGLAVGSQADPHLLALFNRMERGTLRETQPDGSKNVVAYVPVGDPRSPLFLCISLKERTLVGLQQTLSGGLFILFLTLIAAMLIAAFSYRHLVARPFAGLEAVMRRWVAGDYSARASVSGPPELKKLGCFLNEAAKAVAEREEDRRRVAEAQGRMAMVLASTLDGIFEIDRDMRIVFMNDHARRMIGCDEPAGRLLWEACPPAFGADLRDQYEAALAGQKSIELEMRAENRWYAVRIFPSCGGIAVFIQDIMGRKQAEQDLRRSQEVLNQVIDLMPVGMWIVDAKGTISQSNPAGRRIWEGGRHVGVSEFREYKGWWHSTGQPIAPEEWAAARAISRGEISINELIDIECFDGTRKTILNSALPIRDKDGEILGAFIVNEDITDRIHEQERLRSEKDEAEAASRAKSTFLAAATHDLRQPLQALALLFAVVRPRLLERGGALADQIDTTLDALANLIGDVLDVSRLEAGATTPTIGAVAIGPDLERLAGEYRLRAKEKGVDLRYVPCSLLVRSDPALLERIVRNLLDNAVKYTQAGKIVVGCRRCAGGLRIEVHDSGDGIPPDQLQAVFGEFHQLGAPGRTQGVGLGLWIVQSLARALGHRIYVRSTVGVGSCFCLEMPLAAPASGDRKVSAA